MRVQISTVSEGNGHGTWSLELDVDTDMRVAELKVLLSGQHGLVLSRDTKVLGKRASGVMVTLDDDARVSKDMLLRGVAVPKSAKVPEAAMVATPVQKFLDRSDANHLRALPVQSPSRESGYTRAQPLAKGPATKAAAKAQPIQPKEQRRSWLRIAQNVWPRIPVPSMPKGGSYLVDAGKALAQVMGALSEEPVQQQLDAIFKSCGTGGTQLEPSATGIANVVQMIMDVSKLVVRSSRPSLCKFGFGDGSLKSFSHCVRAMEEASALEDISIMLGSFQFVVWMGPATDQTARPPRKQPVRAIPSSVFLAFAHHAALPPLERQMSSYARTLAFVDMMLREYGKAAGEAWSKPEPLRPPVVVWVLANPACEDVARSGHFEDAAGFLSGEDRLRIYFGSDLGLQSGSRVKFLTQPIRPDLVLFLNTDFQGLSRLQQLLPDCLKSGESKPPVLAFSSRSELEAETLAAFFERFSQPILRKVRNPFSGMAGGSKMKYDENGWVTAVQHLPEQLEAEMKTFGESLGNTALKQETDGAEQSKRSPAVFWGILDLKYDPCLPLEKRVKVLETGDGRSSKFSGYGAAIKESFRADKKLEETLHRAVLVENKKLTHDFFVEAGYAHLMPKQLCFKRLYHDMLASSIIQGLQLSDNGHPGRSGCSCVLKLCNRARGAGCIPVQATDLDIALERLLTMPENVGEWLREQDADFPVTCKWGCFEEQVRHWWSNECPVFVAEELCHSAPVEQEGRQFDATMRVGFSLHRVEEPAVEEEESEELSSGFETQTVDPFAAEPDIAWPGEARPGSLTIEWLGGYWKLPAEDTSCEDISARIISKARQGTAPVDKQQLHEVYACLGESVQQVFTNASLSPQTLLRRYPTMNELGAFIAARLACSMRIRDVNKSNMVLGLAQQANARCEGPCSKCVASYIHRNFGVFESLMGRWNKSADHFQKAISSMPTNATARYLLGMQCLEVEHWTAAVAHFEDSLQLDPDFKAPWVNLGVAFLRLREWKQVIRASDAGLHRHPNTAHCFYNKGLAHFFMALEEEQDLANTGKWRPSG
ncbi:unnamed protein product, partial [Effrenium voratum]